MTTFLFFIHIQDIFGKINEKCKIKKQDNKNVLLDFLHLTLTLYYVRGIFEFDLEERIL